MTQASSKQFSLWVEMNSGKSTVVNKLGLKALGLKMVNTDKAFENGLKK